MKIEIIKDFKGKNVKIELTNGQYWSGFLSIIDDDTVSVHSTGLGSPVLVAVCNIASIRERNSRSSEGFK